LQAAYIGPTELGRFDRQLVPLLVLQDGWPTQTAHTRRPGTGVRPAPAGRGPI